MNYIFSILKRNKNRKVYIIQSLKEWTMRTVNIIFEDKEFEQLSEKKGDRKWRHYVLDMAGIKKDVDEKEGQGRAA